MRKSDFSESMRVLERRKREAGAESTADLYRAVRNRFGRYCMKERLLLQEVTAARVAGFRVALRKEGLRVNTVNSYMSSLRAMYNAACREAGGRWKENPFAGLRLKREETKKRAVPVEVVERIAGLNLRGKPELAGAVDLALFSFMACGMPFTDLVHLTRENIQDGGRLLVYRRRKTGVLIQIGINTGMRQLIERYARPDSVYLFPVLPADARHETYKAALALHNRHLKEIGRLLGLAVPLTSYVFRHTWASEAYRCHVEISVISQALGHTTEKMTRNYLARLAPEEIIKANEKVSHRIEKLIGKEAKPYL